MKYFKLSKIKSVNDEKTIELAPINLLIGPNGSGKSSLIHGLLLTKTIISNKIERINSGWQLDGGKLKSSDDIFPKSKNKIQVNNRLFNPVNNNYSFNEKFINLNSNKKEFTLALPINLSFFTDDFELKLTYNLDELNNSFITSFEVYNISLKKPLFKINSRKLTSSLTSDIIFKANPELNKEEFEDTIYKIDLHYIFQFIETTKDTNSKKPNNNSKLGGEISEIPLDVILDLEEEIKNEMEEYQRSFFKSFYESKSTPLSRGNEYSKTLSPIIYNLYCTVAELNLFELSKTPETEFVVYNERAINDILIDMEKQWISVLNNGFVLPTEKKNLDRLINDAINGNSPLLSSDIFENIGIDKLSMLNLRCVATSKLRFIFNGLLIDNINNAFYNLQSSIQKIVYVPPYRLSNIQIGSSNNFDVLSLIKNQLTALQYYKGWGEPVNFFVNFWFKEFGINEKVKFDSHSSVLDFLNGISSLKRSNLIELGFGLNQLIPLICLVPLNYNNLPKRKDDFSYIANNLFLIEEPEANLHPSFQSKLADMIIDSSNKFGHQFLIETHSEYMVRKFQYWVAKGKISPDDVNIYYFDNKNNDPDIKDVIIKKITILKDGSLSEPFGSGFFDEATNLQFELLKIKNAQKN